MRYVEQMICNTAYDFLELAVYDEEDEAELKKYADEPNICLEMQMLPFLRYFHCVQRIILKPGELSPDGLTHLYAHKQLMALKIDYFEDDVQGAYAIDLSQFPKLEMLCAKNAYDFYNVGDCDSLRMLQVYEWDFLDFETLKNTKLDTLVISKGKAKSFSGIENLPLRILAASHLPVSSVEPINTLSSIQFLELECCNRLNDIEQLASPSLEYLILSGKGEVANLQFLKQNPNLRRIIFEYTVSDCDLSEFDCFEKVVLLQNKKGYNRTDRLLPKNSNPYLVEGIPTWRFYFNNRNL